MKIARNRLALATRAAMKCLETATRVLRQMPYTIGRHFVRRCMFFIQLRTEFSQAT
jgi:hypothetical protein